jgi:glutathione S-transferase
MYVADRDGVDSAYPRDLAQRAQVNRWLLWESTVWYRSCYVFLFENLVKPAIGSTPDQAALEAETPRWETYTKILDDQLSKSKWLASSEQPTIADIAVAAPMHIWQIQRLPLDKYPDLKRWMTRDIEQLPCWKKDTSCCEQGIRSLKTKKKKQTNTQWHVQDLSTYVCSKRKYYATEGTSVCSSIRCKVLFL